MKLHNVLTNKECVGKGASARIDTGRSWVTYSDGNDGEKDFYRDVFVGNYYAYMQDEFCEIRDYDENKLTVTMYCQDGEANSEGWDGVFTIPYEQYLADFGTGWHIWFDINDKSAV